MSQKSKCLTAAMMAAYQPAVQTRKNSYDRVTFTLHCIIQREVMDYENRAHRRLSG